LIGHQIKASRAVDEAIVLNEVRYARRVIQKLANCYSGPGVWKPLNIGADRIVQRDFPCLDELEDGRSSKLFGDRSDPELGVHRDWNVPFAVCKAVGSPEDRPSIMSDKYDTAEIAARQMRF
jgi:hypothetical protein